MENGANEQESEQQGHTASLATSNKEGAEAHLRQQPVSKAGDKGTAEEGSGERGERREGGGGASENAAVTENGRRNAHECRAWQARCG